MLLHNDKNNNNKDFISKFDKTTLD